MASGTHFWLKNTPIRDFCLGSKNTEPVTSSPEDVHLKSIDLVMHSESRSFSLLFGCHRTQSARKRPAAEVVLDLVFSSLRQTPFNDLCREGGSSGQSPNSRLECFLLFALEKRF